MNHVLPLVIIGVSCNVAAQLLLKMGVCKIPWDMWKSGHWVSFGFSCLAIPGILGGLIVYVVSFVVWIGVLDRTDVSVAYPLTSLGYVLTAIAGFYFFHENLTLQRMIGILVILIGVYLVTKTS